MLSYPDSKTIRNWGHKLKSFFRVLFIVLVVVAVAVVFLEAVASFEKFLGVAVTALVMITGISWAVRTANVGRHVTDEINMQTYIYLYDAAGSEMKEGYKRIIKNCNERSKILLEAAKLSSYMMLYLFFSALSLFISEMFVLISDCSVCFCMWKGAVFFYFLSCVALVFVCISLGVRLKIIDREEVEGFDELSVFLANHTFLPENWISFYRQKNWRQFYREIRKGGEDEQLSRKREGLLERLSKNGKELEPVIRKYNWLIDLFKTDEDC